MKKPAQKQSQTAKRCLGRGDVRRLCSEGAAALLHENNELHLSGFRIRLQLAQSAGAANQCPNLVSTRRSAKGIKWFSPCRPSVRLTQRADMHSFREAAKHQAKVLGAIRCFGAGKTMQNYENECGITIYAFQSSWLADSVPLAE